MNRKNIKLTVTRRLNILLILLVLSSCREKEFYFEYPTPELKILNPIVITFDSTLCGGLVEGDGVTSYGICYSTNPKPTINEEIIFGIEKVKFNDTGIEFDCDLIKLDPDVKYYIRAFAKQGNKVTYGYELSFTNTSEMTFVQGSTAIKYPLQNSGNIELNSFYISKYEITNDRFCQFINANKTAWGVTSLNGVIIPHIGVLFMNNPESKISYNIDLDTFYVKSGFENHPAVNLSHADAYMYANLSRGRLPTDAEWKYAAQGGIYSHDYVYSGSNDINEIGWYNENSGLRTHETGQKKPNELGLYDMTGNAAEWCFDYYANSWYYDKRVNKNPYMNFLPDRNYGSDRVSRGGSIKGIKWMIKNEYRTNEDDFSGLRLVYSKAKLNPY